MHTVADVDELGPAGALSTLVATGFVADGVEARAAAFMSVTPGADLARLAADHEVDLLLVDAPDRLLQDARLLDVARAGAV